MKRDLTPEEMRDEEIAKRTELRFTERLARLCMGDQQQVETVDDSLSFKFCDGEVIGRLIVLAVTDKHQAGAMLEQMIHDVMRADAEAEAVKEVEQVEQQRKQDDDEQGADAVRWDAGVVA